MNEGSDYMRGLELIIILHHLCDSYPMRALELGVKLN